MEHRVFLKLGTTWGGVGNFFERRFSPFFLRSFSKKFDVYRGFTVEKHSPFSSTVNLKKFSKKFAVDRGRSLFCLKLKAFGGGVGDFFIVRYDNQRQIARFAQAF